MDRPKAARIRNLLAFGLHLLLAVWVGGSIVIDAAVVPTTFRHLPRVHAVQLGSHLFLGFNYIECLVGIVAILFAATLGRRGWRTVRAHRWAVGLLLGMALISLLFLLWLTPAIAGKVEALTESGLNWSDKTVVPPDREALLTLHTTYGLLDILKILAGIGVFWLLARRGPR